jgi:hypothetical protein
MGLDQYAFLTREKMTKENRESFHAVKEFQWRKHAKLQAFFEHLIELRVVEPLDPDDTFNCNPVELNTATIDALEKLIRDEAMPDSGGGFFYGHQFQDESANEYKEYDLKFCHDARDALDHGGYVYYDCWY